MDVYAEDGSPPRFVDGDFITAIVFICVTRPPARAGHIISIDLINSLFIDGCDPF